MRFRNKKIIASFFLLTMAAELLAPVATYALTSGPAQPEMQKFEPAGVSNLVDLFSGDFKYNIPLLDVGGYPVNLAYSTASGMEDEATWVGMGWSLNPGSVNRNLRGLPDDFDGDKVVKEFSQKNFKKVGGQLVIKPSLFAWEFGSASLKLNVYKDNYYGIGASVGASLGFQLGESGDSYLTAGINLDANSDVRDGVSMSPGFSITAQENQGADLAFKGLSGGFQYNTRAGLKQMSLGASFSSKFLGSLSDINLSYVKYYGQTYTPSLSTSTVSNGFTFSLDGGFSFWGGYLGLGGSGYTYNETNTESRLSVPAYGYLNYLHGRKNINALLDFNREKDGVFIPSAPAIAAPVATQDFFVATGQTGSQQFRPYFGGDYVVFDRACYRNSNDTKAAVTIGGGNVYKVGGRLDFAQGSTRTRKWTSSNNFLGVAEVDPNAGDPLQEPVYFKQVGEHTGADQPFLTNIGNDDTRQVVINDRGHRSSQATAYPAFKTRNSSYIGAAPLVKSGREKRQFAFSYLTAEQASKYALDAKINNYSANNSIQPEERLVTGLREKNHLSEIMVTDNEGKRMVYGIPVYNTSHDEVTFSVNHNSITNLEIARRTGLVNYTAGIDDSKQNRNGREWMYSKDHTPPYATSFLLTGILSPDYVDVLSDGITDDDLGTAVKFNYSKLGSTYKWRAPYQAGRANYNEGFNSDPKDDKANYAYGEKEIRYLHSIESKTMIAFFKTSDREDGLGVQGVNGGANTAVRVKKLDSIQLFSKADWLKNGAAAIPVKVVHFEYDYSLYPAVPNNTGNSVDKTGAATTDAQANVNQAKGKLTLKKVYFTFGNNTRGQSNPYEFEYDLRPVNDNSNAGLAKPIPLNAGDPADPLALEGNDQFTERQQDRWGTYKQSWYNYLDGSHSYLNNSEFPYALQKNAPPNGADAAQWGQLIDRMAGKWQLNKITTPTSSVIQVEYESDDYAYVQNRRAMQMCMIKGIGNTTGQTQGMADAGGFTVQLPVPATSVADFKQKYLQGTDGKLLDKLFFKVYTDLDNRNHYDYVHGYAEIDAPACTVAGNGTTAFIAFKKLNGYNPVAKTAWQLLRTSLPQYAYDSYDNTDVSDGQAAINSIVQSVLNYGELFKSFDKNAKSKKFANRIDLTRSMLRLNNPDFKKTGGGTRVHKVTISDNWELMGGVPGSKTATYGQLYDYTMPNPLDAGTIISSGVASYEPQIGSEENPFHEPVSFTEKVHWGLDKYHFIEKPFCETYFPAASVGYSKVTVTAFGDDYTKGASLVKYTGYIENEFYTAKDFPTLVDNTTLDKTNYESNLTLYLFSSKYTNRVATSQGFTIQLNDMHGKPKSTKVFNKGGDLLTSSEYFYKVADDNAEVKELNNQVDVLQNDGSITNNVTIGTDVDLVTDARESANESVGTSIGAYNGGTVFPFFIPLYIPYVAINYNSSVTRESYHSISTVKVIQRYGILKSTRTIQNGSSITAENLLWDAETGEVLLTKTQNEFDDYTYAFNYPAYLAFSGMGNAYKNIGAVLTNISTNSNGLLPASYDQNGYLFPGDELVLLTTKQKGWVIRSADNTLRLIDKEGDFIETGGGQYMVLRSGKRNLLTASAGSVVSMHDPRVNGKIQLGVDKKILDSKAVLYKEEWGVPVNNVYTTTVISDSACAGINTGCLRDFLIGAMAKVNRFNLFTGVRRGIFSVQADNRTAASFLDQFNPGSYCSSSFIGNQPAAAFPYYVKRLHQFGVPAIATYELQPGDTAQLGSYQIVFDNISNDFNNLVNQVYPEAAMWDTLNQFPSVSLYCLTRNSDCSFTLRHLVNCSLAGKLGCYASSSCPYTDLLTFHIITPNIVQNSCESPVAKVLNPYYKGALGNWRPSQNYVYTVNREQKPGQSVQNGGTNIRQSGYYASYNWFWEFTTQGLQNRSASDARWVWSNKSVYYDQKGNEVESVDALNRYGSALFGYRQSMATAIGANARHNEIAFDGFEDYDFDLQNNLAAENCPLQRHFDWGLTKNSSNTWQNAAGQLTTAKAHSGRYSYLLTGTVTVNKPAGNATAPTSVLGYDAPGHYLLSSNELANGFAPVSQKKYLLSCWVNDNNAAVNKINALQVSINGLDQQVNQLVVPVVEGWKRLELTFTAGSNFNLSLAANGNVYIDDVRILPFDGQLNSFVYDNRSMRLLAQLDENNFATFYEYDDEGTPVRVKKETERGIMTLKENRQSYRKRNP